MAPKDIKLRIQTTITDIETLKTVEEEGDEPRRIKCRKSNLEHSNIGLDTSMAKYIEDLVPRISPAGPALSNDQRLSLRRLHDHIEKMERDPSYSREDKEELERLMGSIARLFETPSEDDEVRESPVNDSQIQTPSYLDSRALSI